MRSVLALLSFVVGIVSAMAVGLGAVTAVLTGTVQDPPTSTCECPPDAEVTAVVEARVAGARRERLDLDVTRVERGDVDGDVTVRNDGVTLSPTARYRVTLYRNGADGMYISSRTPPERLGRTMPAGLGALSALTPSVRWALAALPALLASLWGFRVVSRSRR